MQYKYSIDPHSQRVFYFVQPQYWFIKLQLHLHLFECALWQKFTMASDATRSAETMLCDYVNITNLTQILILRRNNQHKNRKQTKRTYPHPQIKTFMAARRFSHLLPSHHRLFALPQYEMLWSSLFVTILESVLFLFVFLFMHYY